MCICGTISITKLNNILDFYTAKNVNIYIAMEIAYEFAEYNGMVFACIHEFAQLFSY